MRVSFMVVCAIASLVYVPAVEAQSCVSDNQINQAEISNLQEQAQHARDQADMATNPIQKQRWITVAESLEAQANTAQNEQQTVANAQQAICNAANNNN